jgi:hypothetical protein
MIPVIARACPEPSSEGASARSNPAADPRDRHARFRALAMTVPFLLSACASPEAARTRGGGMGADVGNRGDPVELHAGAEPYYKTPCVTESLKCNGPPPVFGPTPPPD